MGEWKAPYIVAGKQGDMAMLQCLESLGCRAISPLEFVEAAVHYCCDEVVQWMQDRWLAEFPDD